MDADVDAVRAGAKGADGKGACAEAGAGGDDGLRACAEAGAFDAWVGVRSFSNRLVTYACLSLFTGRVSCSNSSSSSSSLLLSTHTVLPEGCRSGFPDKTGRATGAARVDDAVDDAAVVEGRGPSKSALSLLMLPGVGCSSTMGCLDDGRLLLGPAPGPGPGPGPSGPRALKVFASWKRLLLERESTVGKHGISR